MARNLPGGFLNLKDEDWDSFEPIQPFHTNGGNHLLPSPARTPVKRPLQKSKAPEPSTGIYPSLPSPETTPLRAKGPTGPVFGRLVAQAQLQTPPSTPERVSSPATPSRTQDAYFRPSPRHREVSALSTPPKVPSTSTAQSDAYSTPPVTPIRPKRLNPGHPKFPPNAEVLRGLSARYSENLSRLEKPARQRTTESRVPLESNINTPPGSPSEARVRTVDEENSDDIPSVSYVKAIKNKRPSARATTARPPLDNVARLSNIINGQATSSRSIGVCPDYADQNLADHAPEGPPASFYELPSAIPHLSLWSAGGVGIFSNGKSLKYFQARDLAVLVNRERGEKVCGTETVNDVGHILHYEMGLGKTVTTIALIIRNPAPPTFMGCHATLVVTPSKGIMDHWLSEVAKFAPHLRVCYYDSVKAFLSETADIVVCTYNQLRLQYGTYRKNPEGKAPLFQRKWYRVVLDEAHTARNPKTKTAESIWALRKWHGLCLTGTPAQNSNHDLYSLFRFLGVTYQNINDLETFQFKVCSKKPTDRPRNPKLLEPKRTDTTIEVTLTAQERRLYSRVRARKDLHFLARVIRRRQVCDHPSLIGKELVSEFIHGDENPEPEDGVDYANEELIAPCIDVSKLDESEQGMFSETYMSSKIREMMRILKTRVPGQKTIIFTHFVSVIPSIKHALSGAGIRSTIYSGDMSSKSRDDSLKKIAQDDRCTVIIVSIMAGGVGLNITSCNTVILLEPWWNPSAEEQAISRSYRIGQTLPVHVFRLIVKDSIEESIEKTQIFKREMMQDMYGQCPPIDKTTFEEWLAGP
ncbi:hypothetical protein M413DRAFT_29562 [Hebeloma cylindrosporum]|uniref:Helicase ATP-binding domain-containing protein n=1 Tax=Hebeloma cylindrosporum TaxID=76867 RepID=A0A0C3BQP6_HEBCY|nr:hypothetical protein M413DRAFT_29562 [Hebeloma cylindrosporum h7]